MNRYERRRRDFGPIVRERPPTAEELTAALYAKYGTPDAYHKRMMTQLLEWVVGRPIHNPIDNECCPDFSCCRGVRFMAPLHEREMFLRDPESRSAMIRDWVARLLDENPAQAVTGWELPGVQVFDARRK